MGRLFWKVFAGFWLMMLCVAAVVALAVFNAQRIAQQEAENDTGTGGIASGRRAVFLITRQAVVLEFGGEQALIQMLSDQQLERVRPRRNNRRWPRYTRNSVRVVNDSGSDLLGRDTEAQTLKVAKRRLSNGGSGVQEVVSREGNKFILYIPHVSRENARQRAIPWYERITPTMIATTGLLFSLLFSGLLAWYLARPIRALRDGFTKVSDGQLDTRVAGKIGSRRDELADLGQHFDKTVLRLQQLLQGQQQLLHDVSHELRSPLARIQAAIGLMQQSPEKSEQMLARIERESERLDGLVGEILTLSRLNEEVGHGEKFAIDIDDLIADIAADANFEAVERRIRISVSGTGGSIDGYPELLHRAIENLVRNAVKYTTEASTVHIAVSRADSIEIVVTDEGPGIDPKHLPSVTEPFVRVASVDPSGSTPTPDGFGLGLTIAQRAVAIHSGTLELTNRSDGKTGLVAFVSLPLTAPDTDSLQATN
jgi:two-component system OmpR family sensor kinase